MRMISLGRDQACRVNLCQARCITGLYIYKSGCREPLLGSHTHEAHAHAQASALPVQARAAAENPPCRPGSGALPAHCSAGAACVQPRLPAGECLWRVCYQRLSAGPGPAAQAPSRGDHEGIGHPNSELTPVGKGHRGCGASLLFAGSAASLAGSVQARGPDSACQSAPRPCWRLHSHARQAGWRVSHVACPPATTEPAACPGCSRRRRGCCYCHPVCLSNRSRQ